MVSIDLTSTLQIWNRFDSQHLFNAKDRNNGSLATDHVAEMVAYMGVPPLEYLSRLQSMFSMSKVSRLYRVTIAFRYVNIEQAPGMELAV